MNTAIAQASDPVRMAEAFALGVEAGREAYLAGRIPRKELAQASSPVEGVVGSDDSCSTRRVLGLTGSCRLGQRLPEAPCACVHAGDRPVALPAAATRWLALSCEAVEGGVNVVQLREKDLPPSALLPLARRLRDVIAGRALLLVLTARWRWRSRSGPTACTCRKARL